MKKRIALIIPHTDITLETDLQNCLSENMILHTHRIWLDEVGEIAEKRMIDKALPEGIKFLKGNTEYDGVVFGCTSASVVYGQEGLVRLENMLKSEFSCPSISAFGAVLECLNETSEKNKVEIEDLRLGLITPYTEDVNAFMIKSMREFGLNVSFSLGIGLSDDRDISKVKPSQIIDYVSENAVMLKQNCDIIFISCTNLRAMEIKADVERLLGIQTITSNYSIVSWLTSEMVL